MPGMTPHRGTVLLPCTLLSLLCACGNARPALRSSLANRRSLLDSEGVKPGAEQGEPCTFCTIGLYLLANCKLCTWEQLFCRCLPLVSCAFSLLQAMLAWLSCKLMIVDQQRDIAGSQDSLWLQARQRASERSS